MCQGEKYPINNIHKVCEGKALIIISHSRMGTAEVEVLGSMVHCIANCSSIFILTIIVAKVKLHLICKKAFT